MSGLGHRCDSLTVPRVTLVPSEEAGTVSGRGTHPPRGPVGVSGREILPVDTMPLARHHDVMRILWRVRLCSVRVGAYVPVPSRPVPQIDARGPFGTTTCCFVHDLQLR